MQNKLLILTSANRNLYALNLRTSVLHRILENGYGYDWLMGITKEEDIFYLSSNYQVYQGTLKNQTLKFKSMMEEANPTPPQFHHIKATNGKLFIPATSYNSIYVLNHDLDTEAMITVLPPDTTKDFSYPGNYNHINGIHYSKDTDLYYVTLNRFTTQQFGASGVLILDKDFNELSRFEYGWQAHRYTIIDNKAYAVVGFNKLRQDIHHPPKSGLLVNKQLVWEMDTDWYCKSFSVDDEFIYVVGGQVAERAQREEVTGVVFKLTREFKQVDMMMFPNSGEFKGSLLDSYDYMDI